MSDIKTIEVQLPHIKTGIKYRGGGGSGGGGRNGDSDGIRVCTTYHDWESVIRDADALPDASEQITILRDGGPNDAIWKLMRRQIQGKISGYKAQDIEKEFYSHHPNEELTFSIIRDALLECGGKCHYCGVMVKILYNEVRDRAQWTVDRIYNNRGHYKDNFVIACLGCNLHRRCRRADEYKNTRCMVIEKIG